MANVHETHKHIHVWNKKLYIILYCIWHFTLRTKTKKKRKETLLLCKTMCENNLKVIIYIYIYTIYVMSRAKSKAVEITATDLYPPSHPPPLHFTCHPTLYPSLFPFPILSFDCKRAFIKNRMCFNDYIKYIYNPIYIYTYTIYIHIYILTIYCMNLNH